MYNVDIYIYREREIDMYIYIYIYVIVIDICSPPRGGCPRWGAAGPALASSHVSCRGAGILSYPIPPR